MTPEPLPRQSESLEDRVVRLLREAHAEAEAGNIDGALELASVAYEDWTEQGGSDAP